MTVTESRLEQEEIAGSLYRAYYHALGVSNPDWDKCSERDTILFTCLADIGGPTLLNMAGVGDVSIVQAADELQRVVNERLGWPNQKLADCPPLQQLALQAVTKHLNFLIDSEDDRDQMIAMERSWKTWVEKKLAQ